MPHHNEPVRDEASDQVASPRGRASSPLLPLDRLRDDFLNVLSHELRTPINAIMGYASILDDEVLGPLSAEQHVALRKVLRGADSLLSLVNDLVDMSRLSVGKLSLDLRPCDLGLILVQACETARSRLDPARHSLALELPLGLPRVNGDGARLSQVLLGLLSNAFKFSPEGGCVTVGARREGDQLVCEVRDPGVGIAAEDVERLFQTFAQLDGTSTRRAGGLGLGLAISKALIEGHGGTIGVRSAPGEGSTFWFSLPVLPRG